MSVRQTGSTRTGLGEWLFQRLSAVYMAGYVLYLLLYFSYVPLADYQTWLAWIGGGGVRLGLVLFFLSVLIHAWIGMRSVYMDYLKPFWLRFFVTLLTAAGLMSLGLWLAWLLMKVEGV